MGSWGAERSGQMSAGAFGGRTLTSTWLASAPRARMLPSPVRLSSWNNFILATWPPLPPGPKRHNGHRSISYSLMVNHLTPCHSEGQLWPCGWRTPIAASTYTPPAASERAHWMLSCISPCRSILSHAGSPHQRTLQGPHTGVFGGCLICFPLGAWEHLFHSFLLMTAPWWTSVPRGTFPTLAYGWCSTQDIPFTSHPRITCSRELDQQPSWRSPSIGCILSPSFPKLWNYHSGVWSILPFCKQQTIWILEILIWVWQIGLCLCAFKP